MTKLRALAAALVTMLTTSGLVACTPKHQAVEAAITVTELQDTELARQVGQVPLYHLLKGGKSYRSTSADRAVKSIDTVTLDAETVTQLVDSAEALGLFEGGGEQPQPTAGSRQVRVRSGDRTAVVYGPAAGKPEGTDRDRAVTKFVDQVRAALEKAPAEPYSPRQWLIKAEAAADRTATGRPWENRFDLDELSRCRPIATAGTPFEQNPFQGSNLYQDSELYQVYWVVQLDGMTCP